jgi:hypothetical protein
MTVFGKKQTADDFVTWAVESFDKLHTPRRTQVDVVVKAL